MKIFGLIIAGIAGLLFLGIAALLIGARFADGPLEIIAGGPFTSGELVEGAEPDWSFVRDMQEVQFQLLTPERSRTTWIVEHEGKIYIPSGYMTTWWGKIWKQWPIEAEKDGRVVLRVGNALYERQLVRVTDRSLFAPLAAEIGRKYPVGDSLSEETATSGYLWLFELAPRT